MKENEDVLKRELLEFEKKTGIKLRSEITRKILGTSDNKLTLEKTTVDSEQALWKFIMSISQSFDDSEKEKNGVIYTPKNIAEKIIDCIEERLLGETSKVIDPASGSGSLLIAFLGKMMEKNPNLNLKEYVQNNLFALDVLPKNVLATKCSISIFLELRGVYVDNINAFCIDSLMLPETKFSDMYEQNFDVVIGNPPYVRARKISEEYREFLRTRWETVVTGMPDLYIPFFALGKWLLKDEGQIVFISPNSYFNSLNGRKLRSFLLKEFNDIELYSTNSDQVFGKDILTYSAITSMKLWRPGRGMYSDHRLLFINNGTGTPITTNSSSDDVSWRLLNENDKKIINHLENTFTNLSKLKFKNGIATQKNSVYSFKATKVMGDNYVLSTGEMIEKNITRPFVLPNKSPIDRSNIIFPYEWNDIAKKNVLIPEDKFVNNYPMAYEYLRQYKETLDLRKSDNHVWYAYGRSQGIQESGSRLYLPYMGYRIHGLISENSDELFAAGYAIFSENVEFLRLVQKILSSSVFTFYLMKVSKPYSSGYYSTAKNLIKNFSVPLTISSSDVLDLSADQLVQQVYSLSDSDMEYIWSLTGLE